MSRASDYAVARVNADSSRFDRVTPPAAGAAAFIIWIRDRLGNPCGWRLKPLVVMQGSKSRTWPHPADALAAPRLLTPTRAKSAIAAVIVPGDLP